jgi:hypothetical protein
MKLRKVAQMATMLVMVFRTLQAQAQVASADPSAAAPDSEAKKTEAKQRFERGLKLFGDGAFEAALAEFKRSRELFPTRSALLNSALVLKKLARFDEALDALEQVEREYPSMPASDRQTVTSEKAEASTLVGNIRVTSAEAGTLVFIDGRERGKTPLSLAFRVSAGTHVVRALKEGFTPFETRIEVAGRENKLVDIKLGALTQGGRLSVTEAHGTQVDVRVDGASVGRTPWEGTLPVGPHTITLKGEGSLGAAPASVDVKLNQLSSLSLVVEPLECSLQVVPSPRSASVALDGVNVGQGVWEGPLRCGGHKVEVAAEGFLPLTRTVSLTSANPTVVADVLERDPNSALWRAQNPPHVTVEAQGGLLLGPSLGGDLNQSCQGSCQKKLAQGGVGALRVGYQLGSGLGLSADLGYVRMSQSLVGRDTTLQPLGLVAHKGAADDDLVLSGFTLGASVAYHRGAALTWMGRLGAGIAIGTWSDARRGTFTTPSGAQYTPVEVRETSNVQYAYINPELRASYRIGTHFLLDLGLQAYVWVALGKADWTDATEVTAGKCPNADPAVCSGRAGYGAQSVLGRTILTAGPLLGARYEF